MAAATKKLKMNSNNSNGLSNDDAHNSLSFSCGTTKRQIDYVTSATILDLPKVDTDHLLKSRLFCHAPLQAPANPAALRFKRPTKAQEKKSAIPAEAFLEPLVCNFVISFIICDNIKSVVRPAGP